MLINFASRTAKAWKFMFLLFVIWLTIIVNIWLMFHYPMPNIDESELKKRIFQFRYDNRETSINLQILHTFLIHFANLVPQSIRVHKIEINSEFIKVYGKTQNEKMFSEFWSNFKNQQWAHQLNLLQWEILSTAQWLFAFQVHW